MRITFALPNLRLYGGIKSTVQMANSLQQLGHDVTVVYPRLPPRDGQPWWNLRKTFVQGARFIQSFIARPSWIQITGHLKLVPYLSEHYLPEADVLVLTWWADVDRLKNAPISRGRLIHFVRSYEVWGGPPNLVKRVYELNIPKVTNSDDLADQLPSSPIRTIHNGIDDCLFDAKYRRKRETTLGFLYRSQDWKRMDDAIAVAEKIANQNPDLHILAFGEKIKRPHDQRLRALPHFDYIPLPSGHELKRAYEKIDIFLFTSDETEAFGNPPLEAMAAGCAVVATKVGAIPAYSDNGQTALHCEPRDQDAMVALVQSLIDDPEFREGLSSRAQLSTQKYRWIEQAKVFETVLIDLVTEKIAEA